MKQDSQPLILVVEDERKLSELLRAYLKQSGYNTHIIGNGLEVMPYLQKATPDLVLLDLMLPGRDGLDICRDIRKSSQLPVIMVTARIEEVDRLVGLEIGADDYICKPFSPREVVARVKAVLRRSSGNTTTDHAGALLTLDHDRQRIYAGDRKIQLTTVEYQLFNTLYAEPGRIYSRDQLIDRIYNDHRIVSDRTIDSHIKKLRHKLAELVPEQELIHSVYGAGYRYELEKI
jgi:two-component system response regulator BaeR